MRIKSALILILTSIFILSTITITFAAVRVRGHYRRTKSGRLVWVKPHYRSNPDGNPYNNWSFPGNINPYTGKVAPGNPATYLKNYYKWKSTYQYHRSYYNNQEFNKWLKDMKNNEEFKEWLVQYEKEQEKLKQKREKNIFFFLTGIIIACAISLSLSPQ